MIGGDENKAVPRGRKAVTQHICVNDERVSSTMTFGYLPDIYKFMCVYIDTLLLSYLFHAATTESWLNHLEVSNGASEQSTRSQSA